MIRKIVACGFLEPGTLESNIDNLIQNFLKEGDLKL